jgi:Dit-like tail protein
VSILPLGLSVFQATALGLLSPLIFRARSIGGIIADATVEEVGIDELTITAHPVEQGAAITDHAYKQPARVLIRAGWSNSSLRALGNPNYAQDVYTLLLGLQASREPIDVLTGKRPYPSMLIERLQQTTDETSENALMIVVECRQIILVETQTVTVAPAANMRNPGSNAATTNLGTKSLVPANNFNRAAAS